MKRNILLNPGPSTTTDTVKNALVVPDMCPREVDFCKVVEEVRSLLLQVVNADQNYTAIPLGCSGTGAVEACLSSIVPNDKKILIHSNGAYGTRMIEIAQIYHKKESVVTYSQPYGTFPDLQKIESILLKDKSIQYLAFVHHETTTGMLNPLEKFYEITEKYGIKLIVDAMSSFGGIPIDFKKTPIDYLISSANKCLQGMAGASFVICKTDSVKEISKSTPKNFYLNLWRQHDSLQRTGQMAFTPPVQVFYAFRQALYETLKESVKNRYDRYVKCWMVLQKGLKEIGLENLLEEKHQSKLLTAIKEPTWNGYDFNEMHDYLYQQGYTIYPGKINELATFRLANIGAIDTSDMEGFIKLLKNYFNQLKSKKAA